ncbi:MAG: hypothetical protein ABID38_00265 [Candidatus Diapherotrites archaeon]
MNKLLLLFPVLVFILLLGCVNPGCGDDYCDKWTESKFSCPEDCGEPPSIGNGSNGGTVPPNPELCGNDKSDGGETCLNCPVDVKCGAGQACANGTCVKLGSCGNGLVDTGETRFNCCQDVGCSNNENCEGGMCKLKTCSQQGGNICTAQKICQAEVNLSYDSTRCCLSECVQKRCEQLNGYECQEYEFCKKSYVTASDSSKCCPKFSCESTATCLNGDGCKSGCPEGDADCSCESQKGYHASGVGFCLAGDVIKAKDGSPCCKNPVLSWNCTDGDSDQTGEAGKIVSIKGTCIEVADMNVGTDFIQRLTDYCPGSKDVMEYYCTGGAANRCAGEPIVCSGQCIDGRCA